MTRIIETTIDDTHVVLSRMSESLWNDITDGDVNVSRVTVGAYVYRDVTNDDTIDTSSLIVCARCENGESCATHGDGRDGA